MAEVAEVAGGMGVRSLEYGVWSMEYRSVKEGIEVWSMKASELIGIQQSLAD